MSNEKCTVTTSHCHSLIPYLHALEVFTCSNANNENIIDHFICACVLIGVKKWSDLWFRVIYIDPTIDTIRRMINSYLIFYFLTIFYLESHSQWIFRRKSNNYLDKMRIYSYDDFFFQKISQNHQFQTIVC